MASVSFPRAAPASHPFTCNACQQAFRDDISQKRHMKTDWHLYNLKRKVVNLPPISNADYNEIAAKSPVITDLPTSFQKSCMACKKTFSSNNAFANHLSSSKHKANQRSAPDDASAVLSSVISVAESAEGSQSPGAEAKAEFSKVIQRLKTTDLTDRLVESNECLSPVKRPANPDPAVAINHQTISDLLAQGNPTTAASTTDNRVVTLNTCLFCSYDSVSLLLNVNHMKLMHGMVIPERKYLVDLAGLIGQLQKWVYEDFCCLFCRKCKGNAFAVQSHMRDASHCKIPYFTTEEMLRIGDFYDFRSTYENHNDADGDCNMTGNSKKARVKRETVLVGGNGEGVFDEEGWETASEPDDDDDMDDDAEEDAEEDAEIEVINKAEEEDEEEPDLMHNAAYFDEYELHLPSGRSVGHRSLARYYRQNLRNHPSTSERLLLADRAAEDAAGSMDVDQAEDGQAGLGDHGASNALAARNNMGMMGVTEYKKKALHKSVKRARERQERKERSVMAKIQKRANNREFIGYYSGI